MPHAHWLGGMSIGPGGLDGGPGECCNGERWVTQVVFCFGSSDWAGRAATAKLNRVVWLALEKICWYCE